MHIVLVEEVLVQTREEAEAVVQESREFDYEGVLQIGWPQDAEESQSA